MDTDSSRAMAYGMMQAPGSELMGLFSIQEYSGESGRGQDALTWLEGIDNFAETWGWSSTGCLKIARSKLVGLAQQWIGGVPRARIADWDSFKNAFLDRFGEKRDALLARLGNCRQLNEEAVKEYADRFRGLARRAGRTEDAALTHQFIKGLRPFLRKQVILQRIAGFDDVIDYVNYLDEWDQEESRNNMQDRPFRGERPDYRGRPFNSNRDLPDKNRNTPLQKETQVKH
jgi:hypothetical protein